MPFDLLLTNACVATMDGDSGFGLVHDGAIGIEAGKIAWIGPAAKAPAGAGQTWDVAGKVVTPGLVDPHTHIVYGEEGLIDFEVLSQGGQRWDLEPKGGGVGHMVKRTRLWSEEALYKASRARVARLIANGVTTVESKSGAGLDLDTELRQMRVSRAIGRDLPVTVVSTYLGAHGLAPEYAGRRDDYVDFMCATVLPEAVRQGLVDQVDGFCDKVGFNHAQMGRMFAKAQSFGLPVKAHADQYTDFGAGAVVARHRGLSADHLAYVIYTSGSTAKPKGVQLQHYPLIENLWNIGERMHHFGFVGEIKLNVRQLQLACQLLERLGHGRTLSLAGAFLFVHLSWFGLHFA